MTKNWGFSNSNFSKIIAKYKWCTPSIFFKRDFYCFKNVICPPPGYSGDLPVNFGHSLTFPFSCLHNILCFQGTYWYLGSILIVKLRDVQVSEDQTSVEVGTKYYAWSSTTPCPFFSSQYNTWLCPNGLSTKQTLLRNCTKYSMTYI